MHMTHAVIRFCPDSAHACLVQEMLNQIQESCVSSGGPEQLLSQQKINFHCKELQSEMEVLSLSGAQGPDISDQNEDLRRENADLHSQIKSLRERIARGSAGEINSQQTQ